MTQLNIKNLGQIKSANIDFGDLTLFVGAQATGKSILLQLIKLLFDISNIKDTLLKYGYDWEMKVSNFSELYFGEGMRNLLGDSTEIICDNIRNPLNELLKNRYFSSDPERIFFVPAQRVLTLENGWPRSFTSFAIDYPYVVRQFSEHLRLLMQQGFMNKDKDNGIFPQKGRLKQEISDALDASIFHGARVELNTVEMRKRIQLTVNGNLLPFMAWSAGQREFMPLLLGVDWLMSVSEEPKKSDIDIVVIEEPEMGLHPRAVLSVIVMCLDLLHKAIVYLFLPIRLFS